MKKILKKAFKVFLPPPNQTVSEWSDAERRLSPEASAEPGRWDTSRAEYQRGMMDVITDPTIHTGVIMSSSQIGKTEVLNNMVGYHIDRDPAPMLLVQPTLELAQAWSKDRLAPMLRDTPALQGHVEDARSRDSGNTLLHKTFPGGHITMAGANSAASLASRPVRFVLCDEVDRYPASAGTEGDPVKLARKRSTTFWNRMLLLTSTPTVKGTSRIEMAFEESDQRRFFVPCPDCGHEHVLQWKNVHWDDGKPKSAMYVCPECGSLWDDVTRWRAVHKGHWCPSMYDEETDTFVKNPNPVRNGIAGFHIWEAYSPWVKLADMVADFLSAKKSPDTLKTFVNTSLGETWEEEGSTIDKTGLLSRREDYSTVPIDAIVLTCGVDTQPDRLEYEVVAHGLDGETWGVEEGVIYGDPDVLTTKPGFVSPWIELERRVLKKIYKRDDGVELWVKGTCIDSGGHNTQAVYKFCKRKEKTGGVFAIKGRAGDGPGLTGRPSRSNAVHVNLFPVFVDKVKDLLFARLEKEIDEPGYCHFPIAYPEEYFTQLTSEKAVKRFKQGVPYNVYVKKSAGARNEALDRRVYAMAALDIINLDLEAEKDTMSAKATAIANGARVVSGPQRRIRHAGVRV